MSPLGTDDTYVASHDNSNDLLATDSVETRNGNLSIYCSDCDSRNIIAEYILGNCNSKQGTRSQNLPS